MNTETQYKWLPSEPTDEMVLKMAQGFIASMNVANEENHDLTNPDVARIVFGFIYELAWQVVPNARAVSEDEISKLIYWVHRLYAEIPDIRENFPLFDEVNASGVLLIDLTKITE
jgi:hypothetical protein